MAEHTDETTIANLNEALRRVIAERDELRELVAAFGTLFEAVHMAEEQWDCVDYNRRKKAEATT